MACPLAGGRGEFTGHDQIPVDILVLLRLRSLTVTNVQDVLIVLFVDRIAGHNVGSDHPRQIIGGLAQFIRQHHGGLALFVGAIDRLLRADVDPKDQDECGQQEEDGCQSIDQVGYTRIAVHGIRLPRGTRENTARSASEAQGDGRMRSLIGLITCVLIPE
jgi:hypothetical protein